jgi:hypothetical protein
MAQSNVDWIEAHGLTTEDRNRLGRGQDIAVSDKLGLSLRQSKENSGNAGIGLFAERRFDKDSLIDIFRAMPVGEIDCMRDKLKDIGGLEDYSIAEEKDKDSTYLVLTTPWDLRGSAQFVNDGRDDDRNNALIASLNITTHKPYVQLKASKGVDAHKEILVSYGSEYWNTDARRSLPEVTADDIADIKQCAKHSEDAGIPVLKIEQTESTPDTSDERRRRERADATAVKKYLEEKPQQNSQTTRVNTATRGVQRANDTYDKYTTARWKRYKAPASFQAVYDDDKLDYNHVEYLFVFGGDDATEGDKCLHTDHNWGYSVRKAKWSDNSDTESVASAELKNVELPERSKTTPDNLVAITTKATRSASDLDQAFTDNGDSQSVTLSSSKRGPSSSSDSQPSKKQKSKNGKSKFVLPKTLSDTEKELQKARQEAKDNPEQWNWKIENLSRNLESFGPSSSSDDQPRKRKHSNQEYTNRNSFSVKNSSDDERDDEQDNTKVRRSHRLELKDPVKYAPVLPDMLDSAESEWQMYKAPDTYAGVYLNDFVDGNGKNVSGKYVVVPNTEAFRYMDSEDRTKIGGTGQYVAINKTLGLSLRKSKVSDNAGIGLFAEKEFEKDAVIDNFRPMTVGELECVASIVKVAPLKNYCIEGGNDTYYCTNPWDVQGSAQFMNQDSSSFNASINISMANDYDGDNETLLKKFPLNANARSTITAGSEILTSYNNETYDVDIQLGEMSDKTKLQFCVEGNSDISMPKITGDDVDKVSEYLQNIDKQAEGKPKPSKGSFVSSEQTFEDNRGRYVL